METIVDSLYDGKLDILRSSIRKASEDSACILSLTEHLRDLEAKFGLAKESLLMQEREIRRRESEVEMRSVEMNEMEKRRDPKLVSVQNELEECNKLLDSKREELALVRKELHEKKKQLGSVMKLIEDYKKKLKSEETKLGYKEKELSKVQKTKEAILNEIQMKEKHLQSIRGMIRECSEKVEAKQRQYQGLSIDECSAEMARKQKQLDSVRAMVLRKNEELEAKTRQFNSVNESIAKCSDLLCEKQKELKLIDKCINERSLKLEQEKEKLVSVECKIKDLKSAEQTMRSDCEDQEMKLKKRNEELALKEKELKAVEKLIIERSSELEAMKKQETAPEKSVTEFCSSSTSQDSLVDSTLERIELNRIQLKEYSKELEIKDQKIQSLQMLVDELSKKLDHNEKQLDDKLHSELAIAQPENLLASCEVNSSTIDYQSSIAENGKYLQSLLNESYRKQDLVHKEAFNAIQKSADPGKLVLDAMQGFYPADLKEPDSDIDLSVIRRSCSTLLEQLLKLSPEIKQEVRDEAMKLALEWKSKMKSPCENDLEVSAFLQLLAAFKLSSSFDRDELRSFLDAVCRNRHVPQLRRALGFSEGLSVIDVEQFHPLQTNQREDSSAMIDGSTFRLIDERVCPLILEEMDIPDLTPHEVISALSYSPDPAKFVLEVMLGSYTQHIRNGGAELDASTIKNEMLLLDQLIRCKAIISPSVKEGALKLAILWKENVTRETVKGIEASAFLLFISIYGLRYHLNPDEILLLLVKVANSKHAPRFCRFLGLADKMPELIPILLQRKLYIEAARFSCASGLLHVYSLDAIQKNCVEDIWKSAQDEATENELKARKAVLQCILEYKLESVYDTSNIRHRIIELEMRRVSSSVYCSGSVNQPSYAPYVESQLQNRHFGYDHGSNKRPRR